MSAYKTERKVGGSGSKEGLEGKSPREKIVFSV